MTKSKQLKHESLCLGIIQASDGVPVQLLSCNKEDENQVRPKQFNCMSI